MDNLPELPFEKMLSYLNLDDLFKSRAVCRGWRNMIDRFRVNSLCYSERPSGLIFPKSRLVGRTFAASFVRSSSFEGFFGTYGQSILSGLKKLRFCELQLPISSIEVFASTLQSFRKLEHLSIIKTYLGCDREKRFVNSDRDSRRSFDLNMPMLESLYFKEFFGLRTLTLDAPRLRSVTFRECVPHLKLELVHADSVEWLDKDYVNVKTKNLKNLKYLFDRRFIFPTNPVTNEQFLSGLRQLKELHLTNRNKLWDLFEQRQKYGLADLKFYCWGCLVNGPDDPVIDHLIYDRTPIGLLAANPSKMSSYIPFCDYFRYEEFQDVSSEFVISFLNRCSNVVEMTVYKPVMDIERFLHLLENSNYIAELKFAECPEGGQPQELFDRLPEHCAVQKLTIGYVPLNFEFLFRLKHLMSLNIVGSSISAETVRKILKELPFLFEFEFLYANKRVTMKVVNLFETPKLFKLCVDRREQPFGDLNAVIQFVTNLQREAEE